MLFLMHLLKLRNINLQKLSKTKQCLSIINLSTRSEISVADKFIKNYIKTITTEYGNVINGINSAAKNNNEEINTIIKNNTVSSILNNRLKIEENIRNLNELVTTSSDDEEIKKLSQDELKMYTNNLERLDDELLDVLLNNIGRDECQDVVFEITAGVGGQESMIFAADLYKMYMGYFEYMNFNPETIELNRESGIGGIRTSTILISGYSAFELLRHEAGVHRVQRIPTTEKHGRIHTSTVSIAVLPQPNEIEVIIKDKDLKIETKRASGAGGQHVNTTDSAVRITHLPTGISVESQTDRSQIKNKQNAMLRLKCKIYDIQLNEQKENTGSLRKKQRGLSLRNEKIRTYNYNQDRITDHRLKNGTMHNLKGFMEGGESLKNLQYQLQKNFQLKLLQKAIIKC